MTVVRRLALASLLLFALLAPASTRAAPVRVLPLGDSVTESATGHASYRYWLWHDLADAGYSVDFVGGQSGVAGGLPLYADFDQDHEGHWGWRTDQVLAKVHQWAAAADPDVVLVHLGTNDLYQYQSIESTVGELSAIVDELRDVVPDVVVLLAQIIPSTIPRLAEIPYLNAALPALAAEKSTPESPVVVVDQWTGFDAVADTWDGAHPDSTGERKMSARWFEALATVLPAPVGVRDEVPRASPTTWGRLRAGRRP